MGIVALIFGIISILMIFLPMHGAIDMIPSIIGQILGLVGVMIKKINGQKKVLPMIGLVLSYISMILFGIALMGMYKMITNN